MSRVCDPGTGISIRITVTCVRHAYVYYTQFSRHHFISPSYGERIKIDGPITRIGVTGRRERAV